MKHLLPFSIIGLGFLFAIYLYFHSSVFGTFINSQNDVVQNMTVFYKCHSSELDQDINLKLAVFNIKRYNFEFVCSQVCPTLNPIYNTNFTYNMARPEDIVPDSQADVVCICVADESTDRILCHKNISKEIDLGPVIQMVNSLKLR